MENDLILVDRGEELDLERGSVFFVGTATVIIRYAGFTILTDPNFLHAGDHVHLGYGLRSQRRTNPAIEIEDLPLWTSSCSPIYTATTSTGWPRRSSTRRSRS